MRKRVKKIVVGRRSDKRDSVQSAACGRMPCRDCSSLFKRLPISLSVLAADHQPMKVWTISGTRGRLCLDCWELACSGWSVLYMREQCAICMPSYYGFEHELMFCCRRAHEREDTEVGGKVTGRFGRFGGGLN